MSKQKANSEIPPTKNNAVSMSEASPKITSEYIEEVVDDIMELANGFKAHEHIDSSLTGTERLRLFGPGVRNYGFMDKAWDIAHDNPLFTPPQPYHRKRTNG